MKDNILVFGGGTLQCSIINRIKLAGYTSIVIDPDPNAPGKELADVFIPVGGQDYDATLDLAKQYRLKGLVTAATDKPILMMCRIAEELDLPFPSYQSCDTVLDKAKFKEFLKENNLPHAKGQMFTGEVDVKGLDFTFPVITKPVVNSGSRGVIKAHNKEELALAIKETLQHSRDGNYLIEEYIEGDEISVEALVQHGKVHILQLTDKIVTPPPYNVELGHIQPSRFMELKPEIEALIQKIVDYSGLNNCALHPELKINSGKVTVIEIGPRLGGDFITSDLVPLSTGVSIEDQLLRIATGRDIEFTRKEAAAMVSFFDFGERFTVKNALDKELILKDFPGITSLHLDKKIGEETNRITDSLNRYGHLILTGTHRDNLSEQKDKITALIDQCLFGN
ncbi:ATP-grasp domain-containing protein [Marnyiella aurantia]|uniref:ATP-grasp domain-containing protein n=1 Tax=Marnyiella aurantia TaxID=2758037 RepID=A0A7D7QUT3_9FLAO|nr:ATP-grasp domain-containing protein [Marnyiella aurantia]MBA5247451.1 ATP-grasp domain-containing protein [Marnyiella aurantia]QMS99207.1 ATP-grasp domain-containing protein [Marnyiella aurantia]